MNHTIKGIAFGAIGGAVGTYLMGFYWKAAEALHGHDPRALVREEPPHTMDDISVAGEQAEEDEASTEAVGRIVHETVAGRRPDEQKKEKLSEAVHWSYGIAVSALYGGLRGKQPMPDLAGGAIFGTALWAIGDELMVPALGLSKGPTAYPLEQHAHRWGAHILYGVTAAAVTQGLLHAFSPKQTRKDMVMNAIKTYATWKTIKAAAETAGSASKAAARRKLRRKSTPMEAVARSARKLTGSTNGMPRATVRSVKKSGQRVLDSATSLFS